MIKQIKSIGGVVSEIITATKYISTGAIAGNLPHNIREKLERRLNSDSDTIGKVSLITNTILYPTISYFGAMAIIGKKEEAFLALGLGGIYSLLEACVRLAYVGDGNVCPASLPGKIIALPLEVKDYFSNLHQKAKNNV
ncbi:MAG: hypothetical protein V1660_02425 [archaeon]